MRDVVGGLGETNKLIAWTATETACRRSGGGYASIDGNGRPEDRKFDDEARVDEEIARVRMFGLPRINVNLGH